MPMDINLNGGASGNKQEVDANKNALVVTPGYSAAGVLFGGGPNAGQTLQSENDAGLITGAREAKSPETDDDFRLRVAHDNLIDHHTFCNDTAQYTEKFFHSFLTLTATQSTAGMLTNSGNITTTTTGMTHGTHQMGAVGGSETHACETCIAFSAQPNANQVIDFGLFQRAAANPYDPLDGVYFRVSSAGVSGVINSNGTETATAPFSAAGGTGTWAYANNEVNRYLIQITNKRTTFWINDEKAGELATPVGNNYPCMSRALPWSIRHAIVGGAAGAAMQALVKDYRVYRRGAQFSDPLSAVTSRVEGAFRGLTTATLGSLGTYTNNTAPSPAVPTNTGLAMGAPGLLNQAWETFSLAVNTDAVMASYQNPVGSATVPGRRLKVLGVKLSSFVQTVLVGGPIVRHFALAFGHTAANLGTLEGATFTNNTTKARRIVLLPELLQAVTAAQAVSTVISQPHGASAMLPEPIYINPGEFVAVIMRGVGTVGTGGTIVNHIQIIAVPE